MTDWYQYFSSIEPVCPWSLTSFKQGRIRFEPYNHSLIHRNDMYWNDDYLDAVIYLDPPSDPEILDQLVESFESDSNLRNCIYFWSHPDHTKGAANQAPQPIIIQQSRQNLDQARRQLKQV